MSTATSRRRWSAWALGAVLAAVAAWAALPLLFDALAGRTRAVPADLRAALSADARALLDGALAGLDRARLFDHHVHVAGNGADGSGCRMDPEMLSWLHPWKRAQFEVYRRAAGIEGFERADEQYLACLDARIGAVERPGRYALLALDRFHDDAGVPQPERTALYVPNDYVWQLAQARPERYEPVISVHPYRADALAELERFGARGVKLVKWLPNAMNIDPADGRCAAFYARMRDFDMTLLTHAGDEYALDARELQALGNPLRLRHALDAGVRVIFAHCASLGQGVDLDDPERSEVANFDLFLRLMDDPRYSGLVYGDLSAITTIHRDARVLATLLERTDLHARLVNGSDYPLPAIDLIYSTRKLAREGFINDRERELLDEIWELDPLWFDFALKRTLRHPRTGDRFADRVFEADP